MIKEEVVNQVVKAPLKNQNLVVEKTMILKKIQITKTKKQDTLFYLGFAKMIHQ